MALKSNGQLHQDGRQGQQLLGADTVQHFTYLTLPLTSTPPSFSNRHSLLGRILRNVAIHDTLTVMLCVLLIV